MEELNFFYRCLTYFCKCIGYINDDKLDNFDEDFNSKMIDLLEITINQIKERKGKKDGE